MTITIRRVILVITAAIGSFVGLWAAFWPVAFYDAFPGLGRVWVGVDGPFNEHLIRDVGALYLALAAASIYAAFTRDIGASRAVGIGWIVFSLPHLGYHLGHLAGFAPIDVLGQLISLSSTIILGIPLLLPNRRTRSTHHEGAATA